MDGYTPSLPMKIWMMGGEWNLPIFGASLFNSGAGNGNPLSFLAWEIPWTEEPGELICGVSKRHD